MCILLVFCSLCLFSQSSDTLCNTGSYTIIQPFLGEWEEYEVKEEGEVLIGHLSTHFGVNGCVLTQNFISPDSSFSYRSHGFVNPFSNIMEETYVFSTGGYSKFHWIKDGEKLYTLKVGGSRKTDYMYRLYLY